MNLAVIEAVVRCPYCVSGDEFRPMSAQSLGRYVCGKCGHLAMPADHNFKCRCRKCAELNTVRTVQYG